MKRIKNIQNQISKSIRGIGYSPIGRYTARQLLNSPENNIVRSKLRDLGLEKNLRYMSTDSLPSGMFYAKLVIKNWKPLLGKQFGLYEHGKLIYRSTIEFPPSGRTVEFRNIIVSSDLQENFSIDIDAAYSLSIGPGGFYTPQQDSYDHKYQIQRHGKLFYSLRGNTRNPQKIIFTFPSFSASNAVVPYVISYLSGITENELEDTLVVCFQDRYSTSGSYMLADNAGNDLRPLVSAEIERIRERYSVPENNLMFYGATKGATIAIIYSEAYMESRLLINTPQMHVGYYLQNNHHKLNIAINSIPKLQSQPHQILERYIDEARKVDYFYSVSDEENNYSFVEQLSHHKNLNTYRINGSYSQIAGRSTASTLNLIRNFIKNFPSKVLTCEQIILYPVSNGHQIQIRLKSSQESNLKTNWFIGTDKDGGFKGHLMTQGALPFFKYTTEDQKILRGIDDISEFNSIRGLQADGSTWTSPIKIESTQEVMTEEEKLVIARRPKLATIHGQEFKHVRIIHNELVEDYALLIGPDVKNSKIITFFLVDEIDRETGSANGFSNSVTVKSGESTELLDLLLKRLFIDSGSDNFSIENRSTLISKDRITSLTRNLDELLK